LDFGKLKTEFVKGIKNSTLYKTFDKHETPNSIIVRTKSRGIIQDELVDEYQLRHNPTNGILVSTIVRSYNMITNPKHLVIQVSILKDKTEIRRTSVSAKGKVEYIVKDNGDYTVSRKKIKRPVSPSIKSHLDKTSRFFEKHQ